MPRVNLPKLKRNKKGVSIIVASLALIGVVLMAAFFINTFITTFVKSSSNVAGLTITDARLTRVGSKVFLAATVRNVGTVPLNITRASLIGEAINYDETLSPAIILTPGESRTLTESDLGWSLNSASFRVGAYYLFRVWVSQSTGSSIVAETRVYCE
ncbi:MAG: hypothetical protein QXR81_05055 [Candidatus Nezhaarchaeales archaeon]